MSYYESKGYTIPRRKDSKGRLRVPLGTKILVNIEDIPKGSDLKVTKICDICGEKVSNIVFSSIIKARKNGDGKDRCAKCRRAKASNTVKNNVSYEKSLEYYSKQNNKEYLLKEFSESNLMQPNRISYGTNEIAWWRCSKCESDFDMMVTERTSGGQNCPYCAGVRVNHTNCLWAVNPEVAKLLKNPQKGYEITSGSGKKELFICNKCNNETKKTIHHVVTYGLSCPKCSDGISYPEKFMMSALDQLGVKYETQKIFNWSKNRKYDFYISPDIIIEVHGAQHYRESGGNWNKLKDVQKNDEFKKSNAEENKIRHYITVNCEKSEMEWIKYSIEFELSSLFDLSSIDWEQCHIHAANTMVKLVCELWSSGIKNVTKIKSMTNLSNRTIITYLKQGVKLGWCDYDPKEENRKSALNANEKVKKKVIQMTIEGEFIKEWESVAYAARTLGINPHCISNVCNNKQITSGGYKWAFKECVKLNK